MAGLYNQTHFAGIIMTLAWAMLMHRLVQYPRVSKIFSRIAGVILLLYYPIFLVITIATTGFQMQWHLPLNLSNLVLTFLGLALLFNTRIFFVLSMFWALPAGIISILFPDIRNDFPHVDYFFFWVSHLIMIGLCVFLLSYRKFKVQISDVSLSVSVLLAYIAIVFPLNHLAGTNYGYLRELPPSVPVPQTISPGIYIPFMVLFLTFVGYGTYLILNYYQNHYPKSMKS